MTNGARSGWDLVPHWVTTVFTVAAIVLAVGLGFGLMPQSETFTSRTQGTVSRVEKHRKTYVTYARFEDSDHRVFEAMSAINDSSRRHNVGDVLTIYYDPADPGVGCLIEGDEDKSFFGKAAGTICRVVGGTGVLFAVGAGAYFCRQTDGDNSPRRN